MAAIVLPCPVLGSPSSGGHGELQAGCVSRTSVTRCFQFYLLFKKGFFFSFSLSLSFFSFFFLGVGVGGGGGHVCFLQAQLIFV